MNPALAGTSTDATSAIQTAINNATGNTTTPASGQVVLLSTGVYTITSHLYMKSGVSLRGSGTCVSTPSSCTLINQTGNDNTVVMTNWGQSWNMSSASNLTANASAGSTSITVTNGSSFAIGNTIGVAEEPDPALAMNPSLANLNFYGNGMNFPSVQSSGTTISQSYTGSENTGQIEMITGITGNVLTLSDPLNWAFTTALLARAVPISNPPVIYAGVESMTMEETGAKDSGAGNGYVWYNLASYSWMQNVETAYAGGIHITLDGGTHNQIEGCTIHHACGGYTQGGGAYGISVQEYTSSSLFDNNISYYLNKPFVFRTDGGSNVLAYNYMDDAQLGANCYWQELAIDEHLAGAHMDLMEGNYAPHIGTSNTWGGAENFTFFRNYSSSQMLTVQPYQTTDVRSVEINKGCTSYNFLGNVLGESGLSGAAFEGSLYVGVGTTCSAATMWALGSVLNSCDYGDTVTMDISETVNGDAGTTIRHGNFDYVTNSTIWESTIPGGNASIHTLPSSLYLTSKPTWWGSNPWPWVGPDLSPKVNTLPAQARFAAFSPSISGCQGSRGCCGP